jgi:TonB family protein
MGKSPSLNKVENEPKSDSESASKSQSKTEPAPNPRLPIDLFPDAVLRAHAGVAAPNWGGTTRRATDAPADRPSEAAEVDARVRRWMGELSGEHDVAGGRVVPVWRTVERQIDARFHPPVDTVTSEGRAKSAVKSAVKQLLSATPHSERASRALDPSVDAHIDDPLSQSRAQQIAAAAAAYDEATGWRRVEIEAVVDARGELVSARVVLPSGERALDAAALDAVRRAIAAQPVRDPRGAVRSRWSVEAAVSVDLPKVAPVTGVGGRAIGGIVNLGGISFDETTGKVGFDYAGKQRVHTRVRLIGIEPI